MLLATHDVDEAVTLADRVLLLDGGHVAVDLAVDLPAPRSHRQPGFLAYRESLLRALGVAQTEGMRMLHLNAFLMGVGHHEAAWRLPRERLSSGPSGWRGGGTIQHGRRCPTAAQAAGLHCPLWRQLWPDHHGPLSPWRRSRSPAS